MGLEVLLGGLVGKILAIAGGVAALLFAWWAKGKAGERKGLQKATDAAREKERSALEEVLRQRDAPGPGPLGGGLRHVEKPVRGFASPPEGGQPKAGDRPD